jgi:uncharacterized membrane protein
VFGTPIVGFGLQSRLVGDTDYGLALSAVVLAAAYVGIATVVHRRRDAQLRVFVEAQLALCVAFLTVAVPLALDAGWTSAAWALQGAAMVWLGFRQQRKLALAAGIALQLLSAAAYAAQPFIVVQLPVLNGYYLGALLLALAGGFSGRLFDPDRLAPHEPPLRAGLATLIAATLLAWASGWWLWAGFMEIDRHVGARLEFPAELLFGCVTTLLAMLAAAKFAWRRLNVLGLVSWPIALFGFAWAAFTLVHPAADYGWLAWTAVGASMYALLRGREAQFETLRDALHTLTYWLIVALISWEIHWQVERIAAGVWPIAAALAAGALLVLVTLRARERLKWPLATHARTYVAAGCGGVLVVGVLAVLVLNAESPGTAAPLPYLPLLNPLELVSVAVLLVLLKWWSVLAEYDARLVVEVRWRAAIGAAFAWFLVTMAVARTVHHWSGVPFDFERLAASTVLQTSLSIVWGAAGLAAMIVGARSRQRSIWLAGAGLMGIVVAKLFLVDLGNTGTLARVVSFLGVGVLLLVVGYFAPVPPRAQREERYEQA